MTYSYIMEIILSNLEKVGFGAILFLCAYVSNIILGAWRSVNIDGYVFDWEMILKSGVKFLVLGIGIALLSVVVSVVPIYATYVGIEIAQDTLDTISSIVIIGSFLFATIRYVGDAIEKLKEVLG